MPQIQRPIAVFLSIFLSDTIVAVIGLNLRMKGTSHKRVYRLGREKYFFPG
jgi:hypothetical protein